MSEPTLEWKAIPSHVAEGSAQVRHVAGWLLCEVPSDSYARLIAAAPDLLAALKLVVMRCGPNSEDGKQARAAIAKSEGR